MSDQVRQPVTSEVVLAWPARLRGLVRGSSVALALMGALVGAMAGVLVTLIAATAQFLHAFSFGIPIDVRLSAVDRIAPWRAIAAPVFGGVLLGLIEIWRRRSGARPTADPVEANALRGGRMSLRDSLLVTLQTLISNGFGASVGLEAGYTQIGSGLASRLGLWLNLRRSDLRIMVERGSAPSRCYLATDDAAVTLERLLASGLTLHSELGDVFDDALGIFGEPAIESLAMVLDTEGNMVGISSRRPHDGQ